MIRWFLLLIVCLSICSNCTEEPAIDLDSIEDSLELLASSEQRSGNIQQGRDYLLRGEYINSGIPREIFDNTINRVLPSDNHLNRSGASENLPYGYSSVFAKNGIEVVAPNCLQCHAGFVNGKFVLGLGDNSFDFTLDQSFFSEQIDGLVRSSYTEDSPEWEAYFPFTRGIKATASDLITDVVGVNPADKLALVLASHRNPDDLTWSDDRLFEVDSEVIPADVPAWWLLKKKHAMFTTGIGRGDFSRIMMASSVLVLQDSTQAREIDNNFVDVLAFINSLDPPDFPGEVDESLLEEGQILFVENCSKCHGTYGANETYPNFLVHHDVIQTDPHLASVAYADADFGVWYNGSWFSKGPNGAFVEPTDGYVAPPLDGVWATAPYFHNGSVPTLELVLDSESRPAYWDKPSTSDTYNLDDVGIDFTEQTSKGSKFTYDTTKKGYSNIGHVFGDHLSNNQRKAVIEYLKTL